MRIHNSVLFSGVALLVAVLMPQLVQAANVFPADITIQAYVQETDSHGQARISKTVLSEADFVNLALGRPLGTALASNEVFAVAIDCASGQVALLVYDTSTGTSLVTIAPGNEDGEADDDVRNKLFSVFGVDVESLGNATNGLTDGELTFGVTGTLDPTSGCINSVKGIALGKVDAVIDSVDVELLVPRVMFRTTGPSIGTVTLP